MKRLLDRIACVIPLLFTRSILLIQAKPNPYWKGEVPTADKPPATQITLWGTIDDPQLQIKILRDLADSIEKDNTTIMLRGTEPGTKVLTTPKEIREEFMRQHRKGGLPRFENPPPPPPPKRS